MALLEEHLGPGRTLVEMVVQQGTTKGTPLYDAVEVVLKGPEVPLGEGRTYLDGGGAPRRRARWSWWDPSATTLRRGAFIPPGSTTPSGEEFPVLPDVPIDGEPMPAFDGGTPVVFGHYWWDGAPKVFGDKLACVDYSVGRGGPLVAYRWNEGETTLSAGGFVSFRG